MKRDRDDTAVTTFFELDECIDILCLHAPSPPCMAKLLQLSKRIRQLVWRFLIDPVKGGYGWTSHFCKGLLPFNTPTINMAGEAVDGYPLFVCTRGTWDRTMYYVAKMIDAGIQPSFVSIGLQFKVYSTLCKRPIPFLDRSTLECYNKRLDWFFVARALNIRLDRMTTINTLAILNEGSAVFVKDEDLCLF